MTARWVARRVIRRFIDLTIGCAASVARLPSERRSMLFCCGSQYCDSAPLACPIFVRFILLEAVSMASKSAILRCGGGSVASSSYRR